MLWHQFNNCHDLMLKNYNITNFAPNPNKLTDRPLLYGICIYRLGKETTALSFPYFATAASSAQSISPAAMSLVARRWRPRDGEKHTSTQL